MLSTSPLRWRVITSLAVFTSCALALYSAKHRIPWPDEGFASSAAWNLAHKGFMGTTVKGPNSDFTRIAQHTYWVLPTFLVGEAAWYLVFPDSLLSTRAYNLPFAILLLASLYAMVFRLSKQRDLAAGATCLLALSYIFIDSTSYARPDLMCCAFGLSAIAAYLWLRDRSFISAAVTGSSLAAVSLFTHPNGIYHLVGLTLVMLYCDRQKLNGLALLLMAAPWLILASAYALYIAEDPQAFADQMRRNGTYGRWPNTLNPFKILYAEIVVRHFQVFGLITRGVSLPKVITLVGYVAGILGVSATKNTWTAGHPCTAHAHRRDVHGPRCFQSEAQRLHDSHRAVLCGRADRVDLAFMVQGHGACANRCRTICGCLNRRRSIGGGFTCAIAVIHWRRACSRNIRASACQSKGQNIW